MLNRILSIIAGILGYESLEIKVDASIEEAQQPDYGCMVGAIIWHYTDDNRQTVAKVTAIVDSPYWGDNRLMAKVEALPISNGLDYVDAEWLWHHADIISLGAQS